MNIDNKHSLANYPTRFKGFVVREDNICIQFEDVLSKLKKNLKTDDETINLPTRERAVVIPPSGFRFNTLAVRTNIEVLEEMQLELIDAYKTFYRQSRKHYTLKTKKDFTRFLERVKIKLEVLLSEIDRGEHDV